MTPTLKLKLDENLSDRHARVTRERGCDTTTVAGENLSSASDSKVLDVASAEGRVLITLDKDFSNTIRFPPDRYTGIVLRRKRIPPSARPDCRGHRLPNTRWSVRGSAIKKWINKNTRTGSRDGVWRPPGCGLLERFGAVSAVAPAIGVARARSSH